jgi:hypothetical protein
MSFGIFFKSFGLAYSMAYGTARELFSEMTAFMVDAIRGEGRIEACVENREDHQAATNPKGEGGCAV